MNLLLRVLAFIVAVVLLVIAGSILFFGILNSGELAAIPVLVLTASVAAAAYLLKFALTKRKSETSIPIPHRASPAIIQVVKDLDNSDRKVRKAAIDRLAKSGDRTAVETLARAVKHPFEDVSVYAAFRLIEKTNFQDARAIHGLLIGLRSENQEICWEATRLLYKIPASTWVARQPNEKNLSALLELLDDDDEDVRSIAAVSLGKLGSKKATEKLLKLFQREDYRVRIQIAEAIGSISDPRAVEDLARYLLSDYGDPVVAPGSEETWKRFDDSVREAVAKALLIIGTPEALAAVEDWRRKQQSPAG